MLTPTGCKGRVARLCAALDAGLDGAIISRPEHVFYFSNLCPLPSSLNQDSSSFLLIRRNGSTTLFTDNWLAPSTEAAADEIIVVEWYSMQEPARDRRQAVASAVGAHARASGLKALGAELAVLPALIAKAVPELVDLDGLIASFREVKDPDEIAAIRLALHASEAVHAASRRLLVPGLREIDYYAALLAEATRSLERPFTMMCDLISGERTAAGGGPPTTKVLLDGDLVILDLFPCVEGYRADLANTLCVGGQPVAAQREAFACVQSALRAGELRLRPGTPVAEIFEAMDSELREGPGRRSLTHHGGHGLGLGHPEAPHIVPRSPRTLSAGMVITLEPGLYDPSLGGVRIEHEYLITPDGFERLSKHELGL
jgi:Xaa-Pro aminopeptidase